MDKPAGHYSVFRVPFQIDADGDCTRCGLKIEPDEDTLEPHECPPGFTEPAMSESKGQEIVYTWARLNTPTHKELSDTIDAALRRAKAEVWREAAKLTDDHVCNEKPFWNCECRGVLGNLFDARAAQIENEATK